MLAVTALVRRLNLEATRVILGDMVTTSVEGVTFQNPQMAVVLPGTTGGRRAIASATMEELVGNGAERKGHYWPPKRRRGQWLPLGGMSVTSVNDTTLQTVWKLLMPTVVKFLIVAHITIDTLFIKVVTMCWTFGWVCLLVAKAVSSADVVMFHHLS